MAESIVLFSKHDISNVLAVLMSMYISPKMYNIKKVLYPNLPFGVAYTVQPISHLKCTTLRKCFIQIRHLGLHILYNHFCDHSFHSVLCFPNDYHMVKEEKWNINYLKNINYNKVNDIFFLSVSKVCARLICSGSICPGGICPRQVLSRE